MDRALWIARRSIPCTAQRILLTSVSNDSMCEERKPRTVGASAVHREASELRTLSVRGVEVSEALGRVSRALG